ncbi:MAG: hypothetical protein LBU76_10385 [Azoarcus sp.]|nr:hypothetical protein [Azoarcus sp.]
MWFFKPAWMSENYEKAVNAVRNETDQSKLLNIAKKATSGHIRAEAVYLLSDQSVLAEIAKNDRHFNVRYAAVSRLTDQTALFYIAENETNIEVLLKAVERLTDLKLQEFIKKVLQSKHCANGSHHYIGDVCTICKMKKENCRFHEWKIIAKDIKVKSGSRYLSGRKVKCKKCGKVEDQPYNISV